MSAETSQSPEASPRPTNVRWLVLVLACMASWFLYLHRYAWGVIKPDVKAEFGLTDIQLGWLDSLFNVTYALFQVPFGLLGDHLGPALVIPAIIFAWSGMAAAPVLGVGFWSLAGFRMLFGVAQAGAYPNLIKVTRSWFPLSIRTVLQGFVASFSGRSGGACASLLLATVLMGVLGLGWRAALLWIATTGIAFALVFRYLFRDSPAEHPWANEAEQQLIEAGEEPAAPTARTAFDRRPAVLVSFSFLLLAMFTSAFADQLFVYWIPLFLEEGKGLDKIVAGIYASLPLWASAVGGVVGGVLNDLVARFTGRRFARSAVGLTGKLTAAVLVISSIGIEDGRQAMFVLAGAKFFTDWSQPTTWGTITDIAGQATGRVFGAVNMVGSFGAIAAGPVIGWIKENFGWETLFWTIAVLYVVSALSWLGIDARRKLYVTIEEPEENEEN